MPEKSAGLARFSAQERAAGGQVLAVTGMIAWI
jgi:hypothetical protein